MELASAPRWPGLARTGYGFPRRICISAVAIRPLSYQGTSRLGRRPGRRVCVPGCGRVRIEGEAFMSNEAADENTSAGASAHGALGVLATWRQTPRQVKALLAGLMVSRLAGFLQIFLVLFLVHRGFSPGQAGLALGMNGVGIVLGTFTGGWLSDRLSPRAVITISMLGSAVPLISIVYVRFYPLLLLAVLLTSTVNRLYLPAAQSLITEVTPRGQLVMVA